MSRSKDTWRALDELLPSSGSDPVEVAISAFFTRRSPDINSPTESSDELALGRLYQSVFAAAKQDGLFAPNPIRPTAPIAWRSFAFGAAAALMMTLIAVVVFEFSADTASDDAWSELLTSFPVVRHSIPRDAQAARKDGMALDQALLIRLSRASLVRGEVNAEGQLVALWLLVDESQLAAVSENLAPLGVAVNQSGYHHIFLADEREVQ